MKVITNTEVIEQRSKWAKRLAPMTMLLLVGGLVANLWSFNSPEYLQYAIILLAAGFLMSLISTSLVNNWVREPRADQTLTATLKKFDNDHVLFNYTSSIPHVLLTPSRLYVVVVKKHDGEIRVRGNRFSRKFEFIRVLRFFAEEGIGAPFAEARSGMRQLQQALGDTISADDMPEIEGVIVFTSRTVNLIKDEPAFPVLTTSEFKAHLRENDKEKMISPELRKQIVDQLKVDDSPAK